jgi:hypothetical protein
MVRLNPGDRVNCRIKENQITVVYRDYDEVRTLEVIASGDYGYYLYVPCYVTLKETIEIDHRVLKKYGIDPRFLGEEMVHAHESMISDVVQKLDGMACSICKEFFPMAAANQEDGTLICWSCRDNPYR